nr:MAG TPA: Ergtoxin family protein [Caudoviricetes sp.]
MNLKRNNSSCNSRAYCRKYGYYFNSSLLFFFHKFLSSSSNVYLLNSFLYY